MWLIAAGVFVIAELFLGTFVLLMFGAGAFVAALAALAGTPGWVQLIVFAGVSALALVLVRPWLTHRFFRADENTVMGVEAIEGSSARVTERVDRDHGQVKIGGELWRARPVDESQVYEPGEHVRVLRVDGATALIWRD